ncbi:MAG: hypothetical protein GY869_01575, partial [Planctomycetes bacterium]|nr:hypothetical protein [Planctomycetota bacterium]
DPSGHIIETGLDMLDLGMDIGACSGGDWLSCAFVPYDIVALLVPGLPASYGSQYYDDAYQAARRCSNSFTADTLIHTEDGLVIIAKIKLGQKVFAIDPETGEASYYEVVYITSHPTAELIYISIDGDMMEVTPGHPIYVAGRGWVKAEDVALGDRLRRKDGEWATVLGVERVVLDELVMVYNFTVAGVHTYFVLEVGVLVHNCDIITNKFPNDALPKGKLFGQANFADGKIVMANRKQIPR